MKARTGTNYRAPYEPTPHIIRLGSVDGRGGDYRILVRSSFARYLADWLLDAVVEYAPGEP